MRENASAPVSSNGIIKDETRKQWNKTPCGTRGVETERDTPEFFAEVRERRYTVDDPWILTGIPFHLAKGKKVLEIGYGMGTDLLSFYRAGAQVSGVDITPEHFRLATLNFQQQGATADLKLCDASNIDFPTNTFDIVYSNGVLHHTPDTVRCISEAFRVLKPGGLFILALYYRYSAFHLLAKILGQGILRGQFWTIGYDGVMATVETGADGVLIKPLVKTYSKTQLKAILGDFSKVELKIDNFQREHVPKGRWWLPKFIEPWLSPFFGWYVVAFAQKP